MISDRTDLFHANNLPDGLHDMDMIGGVSVAVPILSGRLLPGKGRKIRPDRQQVLRRRRTSHRLDANYAVAGTGKHITRRRRTSHRPDTDHAVAGTGNRITFPQADFLQAGCRYCAKRSWFPAGV